MESDSESYTSGFAMVGTKMPIGRQVELTRVRKLNSTLKSEIQQLRVALVQKEGAILKLKQQLEKEKEKGEQEKQLLRENTVDLKYEVIMKEKDLQKQKDIAIDLEKSLRELEKQLREQEEREKRREQDELFDIIDDRMSDAVDKIEKTLKANENYGTDLKCIFEQTMHAVEDIKGISVEAERRNKALHGEVSGLRSDMSKLRGENTDMRSKLDTVETEMEKMNSNFEKLQGTLQSVIAAAGKSKTENLPDNKPNVNRRKKNSSKTSRSNPWSTQFS